jgi:two-component system response regulator HydG
LSDLQIGVVRLTDDATAWTGDLERDLSVPLRAIPEDEPLSTATDVGAIILAASGRERSSLGWMERNVVPEGTPVFVVGTDRSHRMAAQVVAQGANDYFVLPDDVETLRNSLLLALERWHERAGRTAAPRADDDAFRDLVGASTTMRVVLDRAARVASSRDATALLVGETGTGKEVLARAIHSASARRHAAFVAVNCSAIPPNLFESELFGHKRGAFTNAHCDKPGLFEFADGGTIFFDEIGLLPSELQAKLLRVFEDRRVRRVGDTQDRPVELRILAATNESLEAAVREGRFRDDLYYRVSVITLDLPPLRDRGEDVVAIAQTLLAQLAAQHERAVPKLRRALRQRLLKHDWPGNVRELRNALERCLLLSPPGTLSENELALDRRTDDGAPPGRPLVGTLRSITSRAVQETLDHCHGNRSEAARRLAISRKRLRRILDEDDHSHSA